MRSVLIPIKSFAVAKARLSAVLSGAERAELARALALRVFAAAGGAPLAVACDDGEVADWASEHGAQILFTPHLGLSGAVGAAVEQLGRDGADLVVVAHADLPFAHDLDRFGVADEVTIAPDHRLDGTNVIALPPGRGFVFSYGRGSYARHREEANRIGLVGHTRYDPRLAADIDLPSDLGRIGEILEGIRTSVAANRTPSPR